MKFPVFSLLAGNLASETSSLLTAPSSAESANHRFLSSRQAITCAGTYQRLHYAAEVRRVSGNDEGIITAAQGDIDTATDGFPNNERLFLPPTMFNRFAVTREINDGLLAPRFAPSQRAWVLSGVQVPVVPAVPASTGRDADDR